MKNKFQMIHFKYSERQFLEDYLNLMSDQGFDFLWMSQYLMKFTKSDQHYHYYVDYNQAPAPIDKNIQDKQIQFYQDLGYEFVSLYESFMIFRSLDPKENTHTDHEVELITKKNGSSYSISFPLTITLILFHLLMLLKLPDILAYTSYFLSFSISFVWLFISNFIQFHNAENITIKRLRIRTILDLLLSIISILQLIYIFTEISGDYIQYGWLISLAIPILNMMIYYRSSDSSSNKKRIFIYASILFLLISSLFYFTLNHKKFLRSLPTSQNIVDIDGEVVHYDEQSSFLLTYIKCDTNQYSYSYYDDKTGFLSDMIMNQYQNYHSFTYLNTINDIKIYVRDENEFESSIEDFQLNHVDLPVSYILNKNNEYILFTFYDIIDDINDIIDQINWNSK